MKSQEIYHFDRNQLVSIAEPIESKNESITVLIALKKDVVYGSNANHLYKYNLKTKELSKIKVVKDIPVKKKNVNPSVVTIINMEKYNQIAVCMSVGNIYLVDVASMHLISQFKPDNLSPHFAVDLEAINCLSFTPSQDYLLCLEPGFSKPSVSHSEDSSVKLFYLGETDFVISDKPWYELIEEQSLVPLDLSLRFISCMKKTYLWKKELTIIGGDHGLIDVFDGTKHLIVLLPPSE